MREDPDAVATAAARIEEATDLPTAHVEKDFWVTEVLRGIARQTADTGVSAIFKGGTSLSKAHGLINRFSEDVDIIIIVPGKSTGSDDRCLKGFVAAAEAATGLTSVVDPATATKGRKRTAVFGYPTASTVGPSRPGVLLELGARGGTMPTARHQIVSLIAQHAETAGFSADFAEAEPVDLHVLAPVRTLIEKLTIVHHAAEAGDPDEQARLARHYYDIWCLLNDTDTLAALEESPADVLAREVVTFTQAAGLATSSRPVDGFAASPAFNPSGNTPAQAALETFVLPELVWPGTPQPTFAECCEIVHRHAPAL